METLTRSELEELSLTIKMRQQTRLDYIINEECLEQPSRLGDVLWEHYMKFP